MSLVGTLAKVAAGVVVAKSVSGMVAGRRGGSASTDQAASGGGLDDILGQMMGGGGSGTARGGSLEDMLGQVLGGGAGGASGGASGGGLQDMLGQVLGGGAGGASRGSSGGGLQDMLGQVLGGGAGGGSRGGSGGGLQDMLGQILAGGAGAGAAAGGASGRGLGGALDELSQLSRPGESSRETEGFGDIFNQSLERVGEPERAPSREQEELAGVLLRAMIQAAKSDGRLDNAEKQRLSEKMEGASPSDIEFVKAELQRPVDVNRLVRDVPRGSEGQVYMMSALAIDLDQQSEAQYLGQLAQALRLDANSVNGIHDRMGMPRIFR